jgi:hypothetical protein
MSLADCPRCWDNPCTCVSVSHPMRWKSDLPIEAGFYYWQGAHLYGDQVIIVQVTAYKNRPGFTAETLLPVGGGPAYRGILEEFPRGKWAGPLPQPY